MTINGLLCLWDILKENNFEFVFTRRLNQDALENLFGAIRQQNGNCINPTPVQFQRSFKKLMCVNLMHSGTENCEGDTDAILLGLSDLVPNQDDDTKNDDGNSDSPQDTIKNQIMAIADYQNNSILEHNFIRYICGYLIKKCLGIHSCDVCESYGKSHYELDDTSIFCHFKAYENSNAEIFGNLQMPHNTFVSFVSSLEIVFQFYFKKLILGNVIQDMYTICKNINYNHPCQNFPKEYVTKLYLRLKLYYSLKNINKNFKTPNKNKLIIWKNQ